MTSLLEWRLRDVLRPTEAVLLDVAGATTPEAAYMLLDASAQADPGIRQRMLLSLLRPLVPRAMLQEIKRSAWRRRHTGFGAHGPARAWQVAFTVNLPQGGLLDPPLVPQAPMPFTANDALGWGLRNQEDQPTCVSQATVACIELMRRRATPARTDPLSVRFLYSQSRPIPAQMPASARDAGYTSLGQASEALAKTGICLRATWPEVGPLEAPPSPAALQEGAQNLVQTALHCDWRQAGVPQPGAALLVYNELSVGRPVAIVLPGLSDQGAMGIPTTWTRPGVVQTGVVQDPGPNDRSVALSAHAVAVVGFVPTAGGVGGGPGGGWFIFRNSFGPLFGAHPGPNVPAPGYGLVSARMVETCVVEMLSLNPPV